MLSNRYPGAAPSQVGVRPSTELAQRLLTHAFGWMFAGLLLTAGVAVVVQTSPTLTNFATRNIFLLFIGQLALVFVISGAIQRLSATVALGLFFVYAATLGLTLGLIVQFYTGASVSTAFLSASAMFGAAAVYGATTKRSLAGLGGILFMGLVGLIVASVLNIFLHSSQMGWIISIVGVVLFTALTAYDVQRIQSGDVAAATGSLEKGAVLGALRLYLDFINLFLFMLRLMGGRR
ncbi:MAG TPA: Bax inhibitor-1/YccA family protein [Candidatus Limnocylindrales bacterium]|nr:Bax inhibitor-1/YccA family protein [Candidatus Limnocylindrales bacterium]